MEVGGVFGNSLQNGLANHLHLEADLLELLAIKNETTVKDEGGLVHGAVDLLVVEGLKLVPLGEDNNGVRLLSGRVSRLGNENHLLDCTN